MPSRRSRPVGPLFFGALTALAVSLSVERAEAYPTSVVFAPSGEALPFLGFTAGMFGAFGLGPAPAHLSSFWGGAGIGALPSFDFSKTPSGPVSFAGGEIGFDVYGPGPSGGAVLVLNAKLQILAEGPYWPTLAVGMFQISPDPKTGQDLGYFTLSKSFAFRGSDLGQLTFGMMRSFASDALVAPRCLEPIAGTSTCVFRGSDPFLDRNGAFLAGYLSPSIGPVSFAVDFVGGSSPVSSTNIAAYFRLWNGGSRGNLTAGLVGYFTNDRRASPPGPGVEDGLLVSLTFASSITALTGWDPVKDWGTTKKRLPHEDPFEAPPLTPPTPTTALPPNEGPAKASPPAK